MENISNIYPQFIEEGARHNYSSMRELIPLYSLAAGLRWETGRVEEPQILENSVEGLEN